MKGSSNYRYKEREFPPTPICQLIYKKGKII